MSTNTNIVLALDRVPVVVDPSVGLRKIPSILAVVGIGTTRLGAHPNGVPLHGDIDGHTRNVLANL